MPAAAVQTCPKSPIRAEQLYSREGTAELLAMSVDKVDALIAKGRRGGLWPIYKVGRHKRVPESAIVRLLRRCRVK
jgi:hypothetical protein